MTEIPRFSITLKAKFPHATICVINPETLIAQCDIDGQECLHTVYSKADFSIVGIEITTFLSAFNPQGCVTCPKNTNSTKS